MSGINLEFCSFQNHFGFDEGPRSAPVVVDGRVFVTDRVVKPKQIERVLCFAWDSGKLLWSHQYESPYRNVSFPAGPRACVVVHEGLAYALGTMGHFYCIEAASGQVRWHKNFDALYQIRMPVWGISRYCPLPLRSRSYRAARTILTPVSPQPISMLLKYISGGLPSPPVRFSAPARAE